MGKLFDFNWLIYPCTGHQYSVIVTDISKLNVQSFTELINPIHFAPKSELEIKQLLFEYTQLWEYACNAAVEYRLNYSVLNFNENVLKQFVCKHKGKCPILYRFLSNVVSFPTSEAIVESWGSTIDHLNKTKPHTIEITSEDLTDTGTVDKFTFIKLNGPPPGLDKNKKILKTALHLMFKDDFAKHFIHTGQNLNTTSKVVNRIMNGDGDKILPCFLN